MPSTGTPSSNTACGARPVDSSYADMWLPERITPLAPNSRTKSSETSQGWISQYTFASRTRRAINCVTCDPKSRIRILSCTNYLLRTIIRRLFGYLHVVDMRLTHARRRDLHELRPGAHLLD